MSYIRAHVPEGGTAKVSAMALDQLFNERADKDGGLGFSGRGVVHFDGRRLVHDPDAREPLVVGIAPAEPE